MDFQKIIKDAWSIVRLDEAAMKRVAAQKDGFNSALVVIAIFSLASTLSNFLFPANLGYGVAYRPGLLDLVITFAVGIAISIAYLYFTGWLASLFKSKISVQEFVNVGGYVYLLGILLLIPKIGGLIFIIWFWVVLWKILSKLGKLEPLSTVVVIFAPIIIAVVLVVTVLSTVIASFGLF